MPTFTQKLAVFLVSLTCAPSVAGDLRIETRVYAQEEELPVCESVTLFTGDTVYDFREDRSVVTIFRSAAAGKPARFVLVDPQRSVRTEIELRRVDQAMASLRKWAASSNDPYLRFAGDPVFSESFDEQTGELKLAGDQLTYELVTVPMDDDEQRLAVRQFLDSFTKLQTLLETSLPPDPRLRVNEALFRRGLMPVETRLYSRDQEEPSLRAEHLAAPLLSKRDRARIDEALDSLAVCREVSNEEFHLGAARTASK